MFANFFKNLIVDSFGTYIEDFTAKDIEIDKWNGCVVKQNCVVKKDALESIFMSILGAPVKVVRGYIQNLRINVPWSKILSSPVEINLDEIHVVLKSTSTYDAEFAKRMLWKLKKVKVSELLEQIKKNQNNNELAQKNQIEEKETYMKRLKKIITENLQLVVRNIHFRFEDSYVSRKDQMTNFGIVLNQLNYSMTNSNFQRVFINIDDKRLEQRSYSMLEIQNLAMYWNSNAKENWHNNKDFLNLSAQKHIDHSKKFVDSLRKKHLQYQQNLTTNSVFFIQPCDMKVRFRKNLSPQVILEVPKSTTAVDISSLQFTIDEEIYKDVQYLMKFFSWHQRGGDENRHFKFRPSYNVPVRGNALLYWRYAISSTVYYIRKTRREKFLKHKRQLEILELSELYVMQQVNDYYERQGYQQRLLSSSLTQQETGSQNLELSFLNQQEIEARIKRLETKLSPEQTVIAMKRAEKKAEQKIQEEISNSGWKSWIPGSLKNYYKTHIYGSQASSDSVVPGNELQEFDNMIQSYQDIYSDEEEDHDDMQTEASMQSQNIDTTHLSTMSPVIYDFKSQGFRFKTQTHLTLSIPKLDIAFVSKKQGSYSKYFMLLQIQDIFYQSVANLRESQNLCYIKNLEIIDKLIDKQKFSRALYKRDQRKQKQQATNELDRSEIKKRTTRLRFNDYNSDQTEIDEEANTNVNNGMPLLKDYEMILTNNNYSSPFLVFQFHQKTISRQGEKIQQYKIDFFMSPLQIFYNRVLLSRAQTFINTASISKSQNASAEANFDSKLQQFKQKTEEQVKQMLKKSEIFVCCNMKGVEILIPDNTNYDASKFLIFQTGNIVVKNGISHQSQLMLRNKLANLLSNDYPKIKEDIIFDFQDEYSITIYDSVIFYAPTFQQLENFNFIENQQEYERFMIMKKSDIHFDIQKSTTQLEDTKIEQKLLIQAGLNTFEIQFTNKEIKELKHFMDNFQKYHEQISLEVQRELMYLEHINSQQMQFEREFSRIHRQSFDQQDFDEENKQNAKEQDIMMQTIINNQKNNSVFDLALNSSQLNESTSNIQALVNAFQSNKNLQSNNLESESDEDEFFDAQDVFDQDIIQMLKLDKNFEKKKEPEIKKQQIQNNLVQSKMIFEFWINKFKVNILEATNLQQDIIQGLKHKLGNYIMKDQLEFDIRYKGIPFLYFEIGKLGAMHLSYKNDQYTVFSINEMALINMDSTSVLRKSQSMILKSQNYDNEDYIQEDRSPREVSQFKEDNYHKRPINDPEDEDRINMMEQINSDSEQFLTFSMSKENNDDIPSQEIKSNIGLLELQISENLLNKIIQTLVLDFPQSSQKPNQQQEQDLQQFKLHQNIQVYWEGIDCKLIVKKEVSNFKLLNFNLNRNVNSEEILTKFQLSEFRILQNDQELFLKSIEAIDEYDKMIDIVFKQSENTQNVQIHLNLMVLILDMKLVNQMIQSLHKIQKQIKQHKDSQKKYEIIQQQKNINIQKLQNEQSNQIKVNISNSYIQIPLKDNKNSIYLKIKDLIFDNESNYNALKFEQIMIFIAKSQFQDAIYPLIQTDQFSFIQTKGLQAIELDKIILTLNENYILLLANLVEYHFEDTLQIIEIIYNQQQVSSEQIVQNIDIKDLILTDEQVKERMSYMKLCQFTIKMIKAMENCVEFTSINVNEIAFEWIFGLGFEDHEDNFVTLYNRNQSQQILQQFDINKQEIDFIDTFQKKSTNTQEFQNQESLLSSQNYEKVKIQLNGFNINILKFIEDGILSKNTIVELASLRLVQQQKYHKQQNIIYISDELNMNQLGFQFIQDHKFHQVCIISNLEVSITNINARMISALVKSIYSCKNILKRGKKRELMKRIYGEQSENQSSQIQQENPSNTLNLDIYSIIISIGLTKEKNHHEIESAQSQTISHSLRHQLSSYLKEEFESQDLNQESSNLIIETSLKLQKYNRQKQETMQNLYFSGNFMDVLVKNISIYLEPNTKNISIINQQGIGKIILIHPFNIEFQQSQVDAKTIMHPQEINNKIFISLLEIEFSLRQIFFIKVMIENIMEEFAPINQVIKHYQQNQDKSQKRKPDQIRTREQVYLSNISLVMKQFYLALIKENGDQGMKDSLCLPMFSIEMKNKTMIDIQNQLNDNKLISGTIPLEIYYFNQKLNFYEPFIEKTKIEAIIQNSKSKSQTIELKISKIININFSVSFYETIFNLQHTLNEEQTYYEMLKNQKHDQKDNYKKNQKDVKLSSSQYYIKNSTGEVLMFKTASQPTFFELQPEELNELDFEFEQENIYQTQQELDESQQIIQADDQNMDDMNIDLYQDEFEFEDNLNADIFSKFHQVARPVSKYRRENLRYLRGQPKKVFLQLILISESCIEKSSVFELNIENLSCQRIYLDEQRQVYIICQMIARHGSKHLIIRSPMQITNNLQIPLEIKLIQNYKGIIQKQETSAFDDNQIYQSDNRNFGEHDLVIQPEQSLIIPLKACGFESVKMRPIMQNQNNNRKDQTLFEWTQIVDTSLLQDDREIFEKKPIILCSKILNANVAQRKNDQLFFVLNANIYSIRSYIDFNTQQTEFISMKYLQISPPFVIQNLLPVTMSIIFRNIIRDNQGYFIDDRKAKPFKDKQNYILETKMNSSNQTLFLNPLGNFDMSICIPGFENSTFVTLKNEEDDDYKLTEEIEKENYIKSMFEEDGEQEIQQSNQFVGKNQFRFLKQKKMLFQLTSQFQNQFNVCANFAFIQGYYHISFFSKYWFLNNTQMPLQIQMTTENFSFDKYDLPYENIDFDFNSIKKFNKNDQDNQVQDDSGKNDQKPGRKNSLDSFQTETVRDGKSHQKYSSVKSNILKNEQDIDYQELHGILSRSNPYGHSRIKPWEQYKINDDFNQGLISALTNDDINNVSTIYMAQEMMEEEQKENEEEKQQVVNETNKSKKSVRFMPHNIVVDNVIYSQEEIKQEIENFQQKFEKQTMISKNSIQYINYHDFLTQYDVLNLNYLQVSKPNLFETPLQDKDQLKRVILFSESPVEEQFYENQSLKVKISDSIWSNIQFDINKLQGESISIQDKRRHEQQQSVFEIVSQVQFLPYPFSFSKLISFNSKYTFVNKTYYTLYVIQSECEENGQVIILSQQLYFRLFKIYPQETSVFHWTDCLKEYFVSVKLEEYEYSGRFRIDQIGEFNVRLKSSFDNECMIINVLINEENNQFFIVISDVSYQPPYRIENLTKTTFKIAQQDSRSDDFDIIKPFNIISFAWSYPLGNKLLAISICSQSQDTYLGPYNIDHIKKNEQIILKDKKNNRDFILEIINEKTMKCVRIMNAQNATTHTELIKKQEESKQKDSTKKIKINIKNLGLSIINGQAREIAYIFIKNLKFSKQQANKNNKITIRMDSIQIDNQLARQNDSIILKRQLGVNTRQFVLKMHSLDNEAIENLYYYKYFFLDLAPFDLNLDGNFCDEFYKYLLDIFNHAKRFTQQESFKQLESYPYDENDEIEKMKQTFNDLKKPYDKKDSQVQKKVFFEQFVITDIRLNFTFQSSPILFREFTMNPTLKFFIVLLSNLKNVSLKFSEYKLSHQHLLLPIFVSQLKKHYIYQCYSHQQFLEIVSSMGLFGNLGETASSLQYAFKSLFQNPYKIGLKQFVKGGFSFFKYTIHAVVSPVGSILDSFRRGIYFIVSQSQEDQDYKDLTTDRDLFEDDISQASRELNSFSSPLALIDTQNRIWMKILSREKQNYEVKKRQLMKIKELNQNTEQLELRQQGNLRQIFNSRQSNQNGTVKKGFLMLYQGVTFVPRTLWIQSSKLLSWANSQLTDEQTQIRAHKVRPPRFVSFRMELEVYNEQKAFALQILNDINLNVLESETIQKLFTFKNNSFIFTQKRFICVQYKQDQITRNRHYIHWNILFKDVINVTIYMYHKEKKAQVKEEYFVDLIKDEELNRQELENMVFIMKIHYHQIGDTGETGEIDEGISTDNYNKKRMQGKLANTGMASGGFAYDSFGDLRVGVKKIIATYQEDKKIRRFYAELQKRINKINIIK